MFASLSLLPLEVIPHVHAWVGYDVGIRIGTLTAFPVAGAMESLKMISVEKHIGV